MKYIILCMCVKTVVCVGHVYKDQSFWTYAMDAFLF